MPRLGRGASSNPIAEKALPFVRVINMRYFFLLTRTHIFSSSNSAKVMGSMQNTTSVQVAPDPDADIGAPDKSEDDAPRMTRNELASILRGGAGALAKWGEEDGKDAYTEFRDTSFDDLRARGMERDEKKETGIKIEAGEKVTEEQRLQLEKEEDEAERLLLAGKEAVQSRYVYPLCFSKSSLDQV